MVGRDFLYKKSHAFHLLFPLHTVTKEHREINHHRMEEVGRESIKQCIFIETHSALKCAAFLGSLENKWNWALPNREPNKKRQISLLQHIKDV